MTGPLRLHVSPPSLTSVLGQLAEAIHAEVAGEVTALRAEVADLRARIELRQDGPEPLRYGMAEAAALLRIDPATLRRRCKAQSIDLIHDGARTFLSRADVGRLVGITTTAGGTGSTSGLPSRGLLAGRRGRTTRTNSPTSVRPSAQKEGHSHGLSTARNSESRPSPAAGPAVAADDSVVVLRKKRDPLSSS
ncbi:MAG: hypothetical protein U0821_18810 [Chloroflexota bacterium]